jgi:nucleoside-diphosphate-sugar epimerase
MSSALILGASGFLGQSLVSFFADRIQVIGALSRSEFDYKNDKVNLHYVDVTNFNAIDKVINKYDVIINCVGQVTDPISSCLELNTTGINNIVLSVKKHNKKLIHISSVSVYGSANYVDEKSELNPETPYGYTKIFSESIIRKNLDEYAILRVSNLYGDAQNKGIINYLEKTYKSGDTNLFFNNDGSLKRYYLYIHDFAAIIFEGFSNDIKGIYNIVGNHQATIKELVGTFESILGYKFNVNYKNQLPLENLEEINYDKVKEFLGYKSEQNLENFINNFKL